MQYSAALLCFLSFVVMASCQLHYPYRERYGGNGGRRGQGGRNKGPHHDDGGRFGQGGKNKRPHQDVGHKEPVHHQKRGYAHVIEVNYLNKGYYDAHHYWNVDCNSHGEYPHKYITGIWDDKNNFSDLDKIKCDSEGDGITLDLEEYIDVIPLDKKHDSDVYVGRCKPGYVLTAIYDKAFGFPSPTLAKCNKVLYGELDNKNQQDKYTDGQAGGPYGLYDHWYVQCPEHYAAVGLEKHHGKIKTLTCAYLVPHHHG